MRANCSYLTGHLSTISGILKHSLVPHKDTPVKQLLKGDGSELIAVKNRFLNVANRTTSPEILSGIHTRHILKILSLFVFY